MQLQAAVCVLLAVSPGTCLGLSGTLDQRDTRVVSVYWLAFQHQQLPWHLVQQGWPAVYQVAQRDQSTHVQPFAVPPVQQGFVGQEVVTPPLRTAQLDSSRRLGKLQGLLHYCLAPLSYPPKCNGECPYKTR